MNEVLQGRILLKEQLLEGSSCGDKAFQPCQDRQSHRVPFDISEGGMSCCNVPESGVPSLVEVLGLSPPLV